jgi:hypothetical protein
MWAFWRIIRSLLQQPWAPSVAGIVSVLLLAGGIVGLVAHWPPYLSFLIWGVIWAIVSLGAWALNR